MLLKVEEVIWEAAEDFLRRIRTEVFLIEQRVPEMLEWDGHDGHPTVHFLIREGDEAVGCARLLATGQIGRMAVRAPWRGRGYGRALVQAAVAAARARQYPEIFLHAQISAREFYAREGFVAEGGIFDDAGIPHITMRLAATACGK